MFFWVWRAMGASHRGFHWLRNCQALPEEGRSLGPHGVAALRRDTQLP